MHAWYGHRYQPSPVPLSGTGKKKGEGARGNRLRLRVGYKGVGGVMEFGAICRKIKNCGATLLTSKCYGLSIQQRCLCSLWCINHVIFLLYHYTCVIRRKEGSVLFNDILNTFYLWLYGIGFG